MVLIVISCSILKLSVRLKESLGITTWLCLAAEEARRERIELFVGWLVIYKTRVKKSKC